MNAYAMIMTVVIRKSALVSNLKLECITHCLALIYYYSTKVAKCVCVNQANLYTPVSMSQGG